MDAAASLKTIRQLIGQTPLIVDPNRDAPLFQEALAACPTEKLQAFYRGLNAEDRRRFHYVANLSLGYESWSRLYKDLVLQETQARLNDRLEDAYAHKAEDLRYREEELETERGGLEGEIMRLEVENQTLRRENLHLRGELAGLQETHQTLEAQQQQLLQLVERYKHLLQELRRLMPRMEAGHSPTG
jgi:chromosome segregation ATPase